MLRRFEVPVADTAVTARARVRRIALPAARGPAARQSPGVSDEQILALVTAADGLRRRQQEHGGGVRTAAADARLLRLEWAVQAGRLLLVERAGTASAPPAPARPGDL